MIRFTGQLFKWSKFIFRFSLKQQVITNKRILPVIVISQFLCTSLWFAGNAVLPDLVKSIQPETGFLAHLTSAVQFGFIGGTLTFAVWSISDRFSPSRVFFVCSILAALTNLLTMSEGIQPVGLLAYRFLTGFFLAGIYPVGMKIAADYFEKGLGRSLGFLVGALVIGTAFPHLLRSMTAALPWKYVLISTSALSATGGLSVLLLVPNGPYRKRGGRLNPSSFVVMLKNKQFRSASLGYFGHMWELYAFWAFLPLMLQAYNLNFHTHLNVPLLSFLIIASGGIACVLSGILSTYFGAKKIATLALLLSCMCCLFSPVFLFSGSSFIFISFLFFWGLSVVADSPLFSTLIAQNTPLQSRGTSLTMVNCIGFSITIVSIQVLNLLSVNLGSRYLYTLLALGPLVGLAALIKPKISGLFKRVYRG